MPIVNKSITLIGTTAKLSSFTVYPQADGSFTVTINGTVTDGATFTEQLATTANYGSGVATLNNMAAAALQRLRTDNGLET